MARKPRGTPYGKGAKRAMWLASSIGVITAAVIGINQSLPIIEPYWFASRDYVRDAVKGVRMQLAADQQETNRILRSMQVEQTEGKLEATKDSIAKWMIERSKTTDPVSQSMIEQHIQTLQSSETRLKDQLDKLQKLRDTR